MNEMQRWIRNYDRSRLNPNQPNEFWVSSKYDIQGMSWTEISEIYLPEIDMRFGSACSALKKCWYAYKMVRKQGLDSGDLVYRINCIQSVMGIKKSECRS